MPSNSPLKRLSSRLRTSIRLKKGSRASSPLSSSPPASPHSRISDLRERRKNAFSSEFKVSESGELMEMRSASPARGASPSRHADETSTSPASSPKGAPPPLPPFVSHSSKSIMPKILSSKKPSSVTIQDYELSAKNFTTNESFLKLAYERIFDEEHLALIADCLVKLSLALGTTSTMMQILFQLEFEKTKTHYQTDQVLLRNSLCSKCLDSFIEHEGRQYIRELILPLVTDMLSDETLNLEMDPLHLHNPHDAGAHAAQLQHFTLNLFNTLKFNDVGILSMPFQMRFICSIIHEFSQQYEWDSPLNISGFIVNRLIRPALLTPDINGLITGSMTPLERRNFYLMAQVLQKMASGKLFSQDNEHEKFMVSLNDFVSEHSEEFRQFLLDLSPHPSIARIEQRKLARQMETHMERKTITLKHSAELEQVVQLMEEQYSEECAESMQCTPEDLRNMWRTGETPTVQQNFSQFAVRKENAPDPVSVPEVVKEPVMVAETEVVPQVQQEPEQAEEPAVVVVESSTEVVPTFDDETSETTVEDKEVPLYDSNATQQQEQEVDDFVGSEDSVDSVSPQDGGADQFVAEVENLIESSTNKPEPIQQDPVPPVVIPEIAQLEEPVPIPEPTRVRVEETPAASPAVEQPKHEPALTPVPAPQKYHQGIQAESTPPQKTDKSSQDSLETEKDAQINALQVKCAQLEQQATSLESLQTDYSTLQSKYEQLVQEVKQQENHQDSLTKRRASLFVPSDNHFERLKEEKRKLQAEFDQQQQIMREMKASLEKERETLEKHKQIVVLDAKLQNEKEQELEQRERALLEKERAATFGNGELRTKIADLELRLRDSTNQLASQTSERQTLEEKSNLRISELESQLRSVEQSKQQLEQKMAKLEEQQMSQSAQLNAEERLKELRIQLQQTEHDLHTERQKTEEYAREVAQNKSLGLQVQKLTSENESLQNQINMQQLELEMLQKRSKSVESSLPTPSSVERRIASDIDSTDGLHISSSNVSIGEIELLSAKNQLQEEVKALEAKLKETEERNSGVQRRMQDMRTQLESLEVENATLRNQLEGSSYENEQLRQSKSLLAALNSNDSRLHVQALQEIQHQRSLLNEEQRDFVQSQRMKKREIRLLVEELNERAIEIQQREVQINQRARLMADREEQLQREAVAIQRKMDNLTDDMYDALQRKKDDAENALQILMKQLNAAKQEYATLKKSIRDLHRLQTLPHHVWGTVGNGKSSRSSSGAVSPRQRESNGHSTTGNPRSIPPTSPEEYQYSTASPDEQSKRTPVKRNFHSPTRRNRASPPPMPTDTDLLEGLRAFSPPRSTRSSLSASSVDMIVETTERVTPRRGVAQHRSGGVRSSSPRRSGGTPTQHRNSPSMSSPRRTTAASNREKNIQILQRILSKVEGSQKGVQALLQELPPQELEDMVRMYFTQGGK